MKYKKKDIQNYLIFYLILITIVLSTVFILKLIDKNKQELEIEANMQNTEINQYE